MKVKLQFNAINEKYKDNKLVGSENVKDALQVSDLDGHLLAVKDFGKTISNMLITQKLPLSVKDVIGYRRELETIHDNNGEPFEISEEYINILEDVVRESFPMITYAAFIDLINKSKEQKNK